MTGCSKSPRARGGAAPRQPLRCPHPGGCQGHRTGNRRLVSNIYQCYVACRLTLEQSQAEAPAARTPARPWDAARTAADARRRGWYVGVRLFG